MSAHDDRCCCLLLLVLCVQNREIRRVMEHFSLAINRLIRLQYGPFRLANIPAGSALQVHVPRWLSLQAALYEHVTVRLPGGLPALRKAVAALPPVPVRALPSPTPTTTAAAAPEPAATATDAAAADVAADSAAPRDKPAVKGAPAKVGRHAKRVAAAAGEWRRR